MLLPTSVLLVPGNPYAEEAFGRVWERVEVASELLSKECPAPDATLYAEWWRNLCRREDKEFTEQNVIAQVLVIKKMGEVIRDKGYDAIAFERHSAVVKRRWFPIRVTVGSSGKIYLYDGIHRSCFLWALQRPVECVVQKRQVGWSKVVNDVLLRGALYQPHPHPEFSGLKVYRKNLERYENIASVCKQLKIKRVCCIGSNFGVGVCELAKRADFDVIGFESDAILVQLQRSLADVCGLSVESILGRTPAQLPQNAEAYIGLSVWHHLAQTLKALDAWILALKHVDYQFVELPEPKSKTWSSKFVQEVGLSTEDLPGWVLDRIFYLGEYKKIEHVYCDNQYANRDTWLLRR